MANNATTQVPSGGATIIDRRRFLKQTASATAVVSVPYLAGKTVAFGKQVGKGADAALDRAQRTGRHGRRPPGVIAVVQRGPHREVHSFGVRNIRSGLPLRAKDHMRIASVAKALSGAVALSLVSKGVLSLNDTIGELLPKLPETWHAVRLRHWLNHTSGIPDFSQDEDFLAAVMAHPKEAPPPEELLSYVEDEPLNFEPGTRYEYSNSDNIAVGLMIEAATNRSYESRLQKHVFGPLGLTETSLPAGANLPKAFIHGYDPSESPPEDLSEILAAGWFWASGGIVSTPEDLNRFIRGYVGGRLFGSKQRQVIEGGSSEPPGPGKNAAGLALFRYRTRCGTVWGHTGNTPGYTQFAAASPDGERSVTVSVNAQLTPTTGRPAVYGALRRAEGLAVCAALAGR
jgi:D-alanyl-D-alanine carboxypeptidase